MTGAMTTLTVRDEKEDGEEKGRQLGEYKGKCRSAEMRRRAAQSAALRGICLGGKFDMCSNGRLGPESTADLGSPWSIP